MRVIRSGAHSPDGSNWRMVTGSTVTVAVACTDVEPWLSVTTRENVNEIDVLATGAVNVGCTAVAEDSVTGGPLVCAQE